MLQSQFEHKMISRGLNFPNFDFTKNNLDRICIGLHLGYSEEQLMREISMSQVQWKNSIDLLYSEGLIKKEEERYVPTFPVITHESGQQLYQLSIPIGNDIVSLIKLNANQIQQETYKISALQHFEFAELSLFIMSDVLLDFVQIDYVEQLFLKSDRPSRNGELLLRFVGKTCRSAARAVRNIRKPLCSYWFGVLLRVWEQQVQPASPSPVQQGTGMYFIWLGIIRK
ncbi:hypothetical protein [Paenibacillus alvei]|uniref:Uncharacterized protein n=1 Tax=Paenibacillus alvei TaxID=44250 RepID=A0AAP6ZVX2_PAEAL|nr:hypothetical protein [Paenibacillus alvei]NOJ69102.1 hypothetical protein [Paenibacillus alvei]